MIIFQSFLAGGLLIISAVEKSEGNNHKAMLAFLLCILELLLAIGGQYGK